MTKILGPTLVAGCMALLPLVRAAAQTPDSQASPNQFLVARIQSGATLTRYLQTLRAELVRLDANGDGAIDLADADIQNAIAGASYRANAALRFMNADLDGDGEVTETELRQKLEYDQRMFAASQSASPQPRTLPNPDERIAQEMRSLIAADADKDGRITWNEAIEFAKKQSNYPQGTNSAFAASVRQLLPLAVQGKTSVSLPDIEAAATAVFVAVDTDGNGTISQDELMNARSQADRVRREAQTHLDCGMPAASERSKVVLLGSYETDALSSVAIGSQDGLTGAGTIVVEPGDEPIYLVVASYQPTIWRFEGAVKRIERVVVTTTQTGLDKFDPKAAPLAGVTGLPADRVTFARQSGCLGFFIEAPSIDAAKAAAVVKQQANRDVAVAAGRHKVSGFRVSSGMVDIVEHARPGTLVIPKAEGGTNNVRAQAATGNLEAIFRWLTPGGLIEVDAKSVVASATAQPYEVAPQEAGLIQLMKSGALTQNQRGEFLIHSKMRFPAALSGRHAAKFLLMRGVPMPEGDPGNSVVIAEDTGEPIDKRR
jgi:Ca2+-binding EF-hand superfamily protein